MSSVSWRSFMAGPAAGHVPRGLPRREVFEEERLRERRSLEIFEIDAFVLGVGVGEGVARAGEKQRGLRERLREVGDERDRPAGAHENRVAIECFLHGPTHRVIRGTLAFERAIPATATLPRSSWSVASVFASTVSASGIGPPNSPECTAWSSVRTSMSQATIPRSEIVSPGCPVRQLPESARITASARSSLPYSSRNLPRFGEPHSSSPSTKTVTPIGGCES